MALALAQTQCCILRLGKRGLWTQLWSNNLRTPFRDTPLFIPLRIRLRAQQRWWWYLYWRHMLEPHVLGVHWHVPSVFCHKHPPVAAMEGASLSDSAHGTLSQFNYYRSDKSYSYCSSLRTRPKPYILYPPFVSFVR